MTSRESLFASHPPCPANTHLRLEVALTRPTKCRGSDPRRHEAASTGDRKAMIKLSDLTLAGWLLTLATIGVVVGLLVAFGGMWNELLPDGQYPAILLALPGLLAGVVFFVVGALVLKAVGLPVTAGAAADRRPDGKGSPGLSRAAAIDRRRDRHAHAFRQHSRARQYPATPGGRLTRHGGRGGGPRLIGRRGSRDRSPGVPPVRPAGRRPHPAAGVSGRGGQRPVGAASWRQRSASTRARAPGTVIPGS